MLLAALDDEDVPKVATEFITQVTHIPVHTSHV